MTDSEKRDQINAKVTQYYPKMYRDSMQIAGANFEKYGSDLLAYCLEDFLCNKSIDYQYKISCIDEKLPNYIGYSMGLQIKSSSSPFWFKYRKEGYNSRGIYLAEDGSVEIDPSVEIEVDEIDDEFDSPAYVKNDLDCVRYALEQLHWYDRILVDDYFIKGLTYSSMHKKYNISLNSLKKDINSALNKIRKICSSKI
jgi:hypothetical protein